MLLSASIGPLSGLFGLLDGCLNHFRIGAEPFGLLDEFAALDLEDLDKPAALMVRRGDFERRYQPAEAEILDLLEALLDVLAGRLLPALRLDRVARRLGMQRRPEDAAVVHDGVGHRLRRLLAGFLVHIADFLAYRILVADPAARHRVIALRY